MVGHCIVLYEELITIVYQESQAPKFQVFQVTSSKNQVTRKKPKRPTQETQVSRRNVKSFAKCRNVHNWTK